MAPYSYGIFNFLDTCICKILMCVSLDSIGAPLAASSLVLQLTIVSFDLANEILNSAQHLQAKHLYITLCALKHMLSTKLCIHT